MSPVGHLAVSVKRFWLLVLACCGLWLWWQFNSAPPVWTPAEKVLLQSLQLSNLPPLPPDPGNAVADHPEAASLGRLLFFDTRLSANGQISCATCHQGDRRFTDGLARGRALGESARNTPSLVGVAWSPWLYWDGRKDSLWAQALSPLEDPQEHGSNRMQLVRLLGEDAGYRERYTSLFGDLPDFSDTDRFPVAAAPGADAALNAAWQRMKAADREAVSRVFANIGKALAAYQRMLQPGPARFDAYAAAVLADDREQAQRLFSADEAAGLRIFIGAGRCLECHNGPLFTNNEFHNTGLLPAPGEVPDQGRSRALALLANDPFNCLGEFSDTKPSECLELIHMRSGPELIGAFRTPSLRNLGATAPYMHKGQFGDLHEVLQHYNTGAQALIGHNEAEPLRLSSHQLRQLEAFLYTLDAPLATAPDWLQAP